MSLLSPLLLPLSLHSVFRYHHHPPLSPESEIKNHGRPPFTRSGPEELSCASMRIFGS